MVVELILNVLQGGAIRHLDRCELGREADAGYDCGEWSGGLRPGEQEAGEFLAACGYWDEEPDDYGHHPEYHTWG